MNEFVPGKQICHCTLLMRCGSGAYGEVWLARDEVGGCIALKIVPNGGKFSEREITGLRNYRDCIHPNLLRIRHIEITPDFLFYTMDAADDLNHGKGDYLPDTLSNRLQLFKRLDGTEISEMLTGLLDGLEELHRHHLVHRDLKPDNILWIQGRPTLADAGLIAPAGAGSLVGTPGFLSPRLLSGKGCAEPKDDFYALGKVIYCALTGNPVEQYPSIPSDLTLSGNADWNRLFREVCESPAASAAAFRAKMQFHAAPSRHHLWWWTGIILILLAAVSVFWLIHRSKTVVPSDTAEIALPKVPVVSEKTALSPEAVQKWNDPSDPVLFSLKTAGLYDKEQLKVLLDIPYFSRSDFFSRLQNCTNAPRMAGFPRYDTGEKVSPLEQELVKICRDYTEIPLSKLKAQQFHWYSYEGDALTVQRTMLAEDPVMQMAALDHLTFEKIDQILASGKFEGKDKELLSRWIFLKNTLFR